jgi:hypothetical protein
MSGDWLLRRSWSARNLSVAGTGVSVGVNLGRSTSVQAAGSLDALTPHPGSIRPEQPLQRHAEGHSSYSEEEGLALLVHGSLNPDEEEASFAGANTELLDYDSDNSSRPLVDVICGTTPEPEYTRISL